MSSTPGPHELELTRMILGPKGEATLKQVTPTFYEELDRDFGSFAGHVLIQHGEFDEPWGIWEMHPRGDEFVYLLAGETDFLVKRPGEPVETIRVDRPGSYVVVPRGAWHTAEPRGLCSLLFVTPGEGTAHAPEPPE